MSWSWSETPCVRCGGMLQDREIVSDSQLCPYCEVEVEEGLVWPWLMTEECMNRVIDILERRTADDRVPARGADVPC